MAGGQIIKRRWAKLRDRDWPVACALAVLPFLFFWHATLGRVTLGDKDAVFWFLPAYKFVAAELRAGRLPLWNPYQYSGTPLFAEWQAGVLDPLNWIYLFEATSRTLTVSCELSFAIALLATFAYTRSLGLTRRAAVVAAIIYALSGFMVGRTLYPAFLRIVALTPLVLCCTERLYQRGRWRDAVYGALIITWQLFAAHPQPLIYSALLASAYALFSVVFRTEKPAAHNHTNTITAPRKAQFRFLPQFALMFIAGAALAAVQLIPAAEFASQSVRQQWPYALFTLNSLHPVSLLTLLFPFFHGEGRGFYRLDYWGVYWHHNEAQIYLGVLALTLALTGARLAWLARQRVMIFWSAVAIIGALLALGQYFAPLARLLYHVPLLNHFRSPNRHWMEVTLALAVLAGYAVDHLLRAPVAQTLVGGVNAAAQTKVRATCLITAAVLTALCGAIGGLALWRPDWMEQALRAVMDLRYWPAGFLQAAGAEVYLPIISALIACGLLYWFVRAPLKAWRYGLVVGWLLIDFHLYALFAPISGQSGLEALLGRAVPESLAAQQQPAAPFRYHVLLNPATGEFNPFWFYGHEAAGGYDPLLGERYKIFSGTDEAGRAFVSTLLEAQDRTLDLLNVRYVFAPPTVLMPHNGRTATPRWRELPIRSSIYAYRNFRIYENLRQLPRAWIVTRVQTAYEGDQLKTIRGELPDASSFDPRTTALVDHETAARLPHELSGASSDPAPSGETRIVSRQPNRMVIETKTAQPSLLVLSEIFYPGWRAQVDGRRAEIWRVNYDLRAVELAAGKQRIELIYAPASIKVGAVVSLTTALVLLLVVVWEKRRLRGAAA